MAKLIQMQPWRDRLLGLDSDGNIYDIEIVDEHGYLRAGGQRIMLLSSGLPAWRDRTGNPCPDCQGSITHRIGCPGLKP